MIDNDFPAPSEGFVLTYTIIATDVKKSRDWYKDILDGKVLMEPSEEGSPCVMKVANSWIIINSGGGLPTDDKPVTKVAVKENQDLLSNFLNVRVADIQSFYETHKDKGNFITEPKVHTSEIRCYMQDPDGYLIEVGQMYSQ